jgi:ADP-ribose pyrophosphatase
MALFLRGAKKERSFDDFPDVCSNGTRAVRRQADRNFAYDEADRLSPSEDAMPFSGSGREWPTIRTERGPDLRIFRTRYDWVKNPRNGKTLQALILEASDWVNVVALTANGRIVAVRQYRFGAGKLSVEIPAGLVDPGETPLQAARRELQEETGYAAEEWIPMGWSYANPAFLNNRAHHFLARGARRTGDPHPEDGEDLECDELTIDQARQAIREGRMRNAMTLLALSKVFDMREAGENY